MNNKKVIEFGLSYEELWRSRRVLSGILFTVGSVNRSIGWYSGLSSDYRPSVDRVLTNYWPVRRSSIDQLSAKCRWTKSYIGRDTSGTTIDRVSTDYRPLYRPTIDRVSTDYRPSVDRLLTDCRPTVDRLSTAISTAISTDRSVDTTYSKHDPRNTLLDLHNSS